MDKIRITDVIERFSGKEDVHEWVERYKLAIKLRNVDSKDCASMLALLLEGPALQVYMEMDKKEKDNQQAIIDALTNAFGITIHEAYQRFKNRTLQSGESPDSMLNDLRRLTRAMKVKEGAADQLLLCQFVAALPFDTASIVKSLAGDKTLVQVLSIAKSVLAEKQESFNPGSAGTFGAVGRGTGFMPRGRGRGRNGRGGSCFRCGRAGHFVNNCPMPDARNVKPSMNQGNTTGNVAFAQNFANAVSEAPPCPTFSGNFQGGAPGQLENQWY